MNKKLIPVLIFLAALIVGGGGYYLYQVHKVLPAQAAAKIAMDFINKSIEQNNVTAELLSVSKESGVYKIHIKIADQEYDSFVSKDGKYLFSSAFLLNQEIEEPSQEQ